MVSYKAALQQNNDMLNTMQNTMDRLADTLNDFSNKQQQFTQQRKEAIKVEKALNKELVTREETLKAAFKLLGKNGQEVKKFEIISKKSFNAFIKEGGNAFDYFDLALSSANQRVKIFGVEASLARKIMYGFLPPGMFRMVNKISTSFRFLGGVLRKTGQQGQETDNIFRKTVRTLISLPKLMKMTRGDFSRFGDKIKAKPLGGYKNLTKLRRMKGGIKQQKQRIAQVKADASSDYYRGNISKSEKDSIIAKELDKLNKMEISKKNFLKKTPMYKFFKNVSKLPKLLFNFIKLGLRFMLATMLYFTLFLTVAYILWKTIGKSIIEAITNAWPAIKEASQLIMGSLSLVWNGVKNIFSAFFGDGDLTNIIDGVLQIGAGILGVAIGILGVALVALGGILIEFGKSIWKRFTEWLGGFKGDVAAQMKLLVGTVAIISAIALFMFGAPIWLAALAFLVIYRAGAFIIKKLKDIIPGFSSGGMVSNGMQIVGEKGPELVSLPAGSRVHSNSNSKRMMGGTVTNFNITINAKDSSKAEMRRMADEIGRMVNSKINRSTSFSTLR